MKGQNTTKPKTRQLMKIGEWKLKEGRAWKSSSHIILIGKGNLWERERGGKGKKRKGKERKRKEKRRGKKSGACRGKKLH